ncbi:MAG: hypothetical protein KC621_09745 [Myxococcales bacterium]|nr:hypothetical protein [Myxococcales bacterium]
MLGAVILACSGAPEPVPTDVATTPPETGSTTTETGTTDTGGTTSPGPDIKQLAQSLQALLDLLPHISLVPCYDAWDESSADRDPDCPQYLSVGPVTLWDDICVTDAGTQYGGILTTTFEQSAYVEEHLREPIMNEYGHEVVAGYSLDAVPGPIVNGIGMDGTVSLFLPGSRDPDFLFSGQGISTTFTIDGLTVREIDFEGFCESTNANPKSWLGHHSMWIALSQLSAEGTDDYLTVMHGSMSDLPGLYSSASITDLVFRPEAIVGGPDPADPKEVLPPKCDLEPTGAIDLREKEGALWTVTFDPAVCDGCGEITGNGQSFGQLCVDFLPLRDALADTDLGRLPFMSSGPTPAPAATPLGPSDPARSLQTLSGTSP